MREKAVGEVFDTGFHAGAQPLPDAPALFYGVPVVLLQQAVRGIFGRARQAGAVQQPVENSKVSEPLLFKNLAQVELDIGLPAHKGAVAQQAHHETVGDKSPDVIGPVQVFLHQRMRRKA
ncbi:hypothetical protein J8C00_15895 [Chloracidobacterium sp. E]|uniref:Uncharacterized protein n=1 Tax=Chloracidobacterium thermophilum (strain B) TaxID=981222 RepID=G2LL33_CHLTF|nr:hypothetical protein Cabther_B0711 [Chloracidobacterium thermophilum B]QUV98460.1 hypothetical protein J8C00_15895 [Chloracidobacterium sp. E]